MSIIRLFTIIVFVAILSVGVGFNAPSTVHAVNHVDSEVRSERITDRRCTIAQARLEAAKNRYENIEDRRSAKYSELTDRVDSVITRAEDAGYDVSDLNAARSAVQAEIEAYKTQARELYDALASTEQLACDESDTPYLDSLGEARAELRDVRQTALDVHNTFQEQVIPELKELGTWAKEQQ